MSKKQLPNHQNPEWLFNQANNFLWYGQIAKIAGVTPATIVKYMAQNNIYTAIPESIAKNVDIRSSRKGALFSLILPGNPVIKKNSNPTSRLGMRLPNKNYVPYAEINVPFLRNYKEKTNIFVDYPVTIQFLFYKDSHRKTDISNLYEAPQDIMVKSGLLKDDNSEIIVSHHSDSRVLYDKIFPRTEIYFYKAGDNAEI